MVFLYAVLDSGLAEGRPHPFLHSRESADRRDDCHVPVDSNGVDERWDAGTVYGIHWFSPEFFQSAVPARLIRSMFCSHLVCVGLPPFACLMSIALLSLSLSLASFVHCPSPRFDSRV